MATAWSRQALVGPSISGRRFGGPIRPCLTLAALPVPLFYFPLAASVSIREGWLPPEDAEYELTPLPLEGADASGGPLPIDLSLPATISHVVGPASPLYGLSPEAMASPARDMELLLVFDGVDAPTSVSFHATKSYSPLDVLSGMRFVNCVSRCAATGRLAVDLDKLDGTADWEEWQSDHEARRQRGLEGPGPLGPE